MKSTSFKLAAIVFAVLLLFTVRGYWLSFENPMGMAFYEMSLLDQISFVACFASAVILWLWMLIDFFRNRPPHPVFWGFFLVFGTFLGAVAYFLFPFRSRCSGAGKEGA